MGGGGDSHVKRAGMLVVSLRGVNLGVWSQLGSSGQNAIIFSRYICYVLKWSLSGVNKTFGQPRLVSFRGLICFIHLFGRITPGQKTNFGDKTRKV